MKLLYLLYKSKLRPLPLTLIAKWNILLLEKSASNENHWENN